MIQIRQMLHIFLLYITRQALLCACENSGRGEDPFPSSMKTYTEEDTEKINKKIGDFFSNIFFWVDVWLDL